MQQPGEPSVEEILESIKKVIARENAPAVPAPRRRAPSSSTAGEPVGPAEAGEAKDVLELDEAAMLALTEHDEDDHPIEEEDGNAVTAPLTGEATVNAMRENFAALAMLAQPGRPPQIVRSGETSLEGLTRELLRPMLATWLEDHLPGMVEELVKAEIARIAGKKS